MDNLEHRAHSRRQSLRAAGGLFLGVLSTECVWARSDQERQPVALSHPRAIAGDRIEPRWDELLTITIGPKDADIMGTTDKAIQAAVDFVVQRGGGTVHILPGTYRVRNAIYLSSRLRIKGSGPETILIKEPSTTTKLAPTPTGTTKKSRWPTPAASVSATAYA